MLFIAIEIAMIVLFITVLADALWSYDKDKKKLLLLVLAFIYAIIFENFNIFLAQGHIGSYFYNPGFSLWIWHTPLYIALAWASLIYTAMHLSDMLQLKTLTKPFMDALLVLLIDLTLDVVAVRQNLWYWVGHSQAQGWFGVPADNFIGWLFVTFMFSFLFRYFARTNDDMVNKTTRTEYYFMLPVFAYLAMMVMFSLVNLAEDMLKLTRSEELFLLWAIVILFAFMLRHPKQRDVETFKTTNYTIFTILFTRLLFYSYIAWSFVFLRTYQENIVLVIILLVTIIAELLIYHSAFGQVGGRIEFGSELKKMERY
ncbi:carotenoid biosynthesis protein [Candidatus Woesearchaeota archaeon]|nr:carotenoid biosynthesis protein [Candidatus Woesearchaeota archaeon]